MPAPDEQANLTPEELPIGQTASASDPNDEIPVPIAMEPAEIDERAQVVEALRGNAQPRPSDDDRLQA
jgi:hypothetical protein